jgi:ubiquinone/menaquinone biosynthesis C-methylase UbiE
MHAVAPPPRDPLSEPAPWNAIAADYDQVWFERLPELTDRAIELLAPESGDRVLDVAAGPGTQAVRLAPRVGHVMAIDFAESMIERLRGHIMRSRLPNLEGRLMNAQELAFDDASFDAAISLFGVSWFDDPKRGLGEMFRVVVPGGRVVLGDWADAEQNTLLGAGLAALGQVLPESAQGLVSRASAAPDVIERQLDTAGFEQVASHGFELSIRCASVDEYWSSFERGSAELLLLRQQLGAEPYAHAVARARDSLRESFGSEAFELRCSVVLTYAERPLSAA